MLEIFFSQVETTTENFTFYIGDELALRLKNVFFDEKLCSEVITSAWIIFSKKSRIIDNSLTSNGRSLQEILKPRSYSFAQSIQQDLSLRFSP